jgi:hypothetical protein
LRGNWGDRPDLQLNQESLLVDQTCTNAACRTGVLPLKRGYLKKEKDRGTTMKWPGDVRALSNYIFTIAC